MSSCSSWSFSTAESLSSGDDDSCSVGSEQLRASNYSSSLTEQTSSEDSSSSLKSEISSWTSSDCDLSSSPEQITTPLSPPYLPPKKLAASPLAHQRAETTPLINLSKLDMVDDLYTFSPCEPHCTMQSSTLKNKIFYDTLFEKIPTSLLRNTARGASIQSPPLSDGSQIDKTVISLEAIKKQICQRKICQKLDVVWSNQIHSLYRLDKGDWEYITAAWQADRLNKDLIIGATMTMDDYQRISIRDRKRLLVIFHPDKNRGAQVEALYNIIFKKINGLYNDCPKTSNSK